MAKAFEEFDSFFKTTSKTSKAFVRGDVINPNAGGQKSKEGEREKGTGREKEGGREGRKEGGKGREGRDGKERIREIK